MSVHPPELRTRIDDAPMTRLQWSAIAVCVLLNVLDGFDVLVMSFTAAAVSAEWALSGSHWACCSARAWSAWPSARCSWRRWPTASDGVP